MGQIRAAFDIGSSHHKLTVGLVDLCGAIEVPKMTVLHSSSIRVPLADAMNTKGGGRYLPPALLEQSRQAMRQLKSIAASYDAVSMSAIATAVFRQASNGPTYLNEFDMPVSILSQEDEGKLSFETALVSAPSIRSKDNLVVWDSGGASTQFTYMSQDGLRVFGLPIGSGILRKIYSENNNDVKKLVRWIKTKVEESSSPSSLSSFRNKLRSKELQMVAIGNVSSMFASVSNYANSKKFYQSDVSKTIDVYLKKHDHHQVPKLVLLMTLMNIFHIHSVQHVQSNGSCIGLLVSQDSSFWPPLSSQQQLPLSIDDPQLIPT